MPFAYDTWNGSWGAAWANSWGVQSTPIPPVPPATVNYQGDGKGKSKRRNRTYDLFADIERTLRNQIEPAVELGVVATVGTANAVSGHVDSALDAALRELTLISHGYADLSARVAEIRRDVAAYEARRQREIDDDDDEFLLMT